MGRKLGKVLTPVMQRMMEALHAADLGELADALGAPEGTVRNWHKRESVPFEWINKAAELTKKPVEWFVSNQIREASSFFSSPGLTSSVSGRGAENGLLVLDSVAPTGASRKLEESVGATATEIGHESQLHAGKQVASTGRSDRSDINPYAAVIDAGNPLPAKEVEKTYPVNPPKREGATTGAGPALHSPDKDVVEPLKLIAQGQGFAVEYTVIPWHEQEDAENRDVRFGSIAFATSFMERRFGRRQGFELLFARGNAMEPDLLDGDEVVINTNVTSFEENGIYALSIRGRVMLRRVQVLPDGSLRISSANPSYEAIDVAENKADSLKIVGRMVWPRVR